MKIGAKYLDSKQTSEELDRLYKIFKKFLVKAGRISE
jgi:hypothetical protein